LTLSNKTIKKVHVIYKTHLDIGFTDLAENVVEQYIESYIPKAIKLAEELEKNNSKAKFVWTTGSWLIHEYLKRKKGVEKERFIRAIEKGYITWHALPFTTHTELMDKSLFEYGLSISEKLDDKFNKQTITAKMTDVPGHTKSIVPIMANNNIEYLHLGVNPASTVPDVPKLFVWKGIDDTEIIVNYSENYGDVLKIDGLDEVMLFAHTGDNYGPPEMEEIEKEFESLQKEFPNAEIEGSTMDQFVRKLLKYKHKLPIIYEEIGDSWIHGVGTDPKKVSQFRELLRLRNKWIKNNSLREGSQEYIDFSDALLLIAEHTWGLDEKKFLGDYKNYNKDDFKQARKLNKVSEDAVPDKYKYISLFALGEVEANKLKNEELSLERSYEHFESSWKEQREYITRAINSLTEDKQEEVNESLSLLEVRREKKPYQEELLIGKRYNLGCFTVAFSENGSINYLEENGKKTWIEDEGYLGRFCYETFGVSDYDRWFNQYVKNSDSTYNWSDADQGKPGMALVSPKPEYKFSKPYIVNISKKDKVNSSEVLIILKFSNHVSDLYGAPKNVSIKYTFYKNKSDIDIELDWYEKDANRLPEALWFSFNIPTNNPNLWEIDKVGRLISPMNVVKGGNRNLHAVDTGAYYYGSEGNIHLLTKDAVLLSPGEKRLLTFDNTFADISGGLHFNLYNNIWGTNFPMWYEEDSKFRFQIKLESYE